MQTVNIDISDSGRTIIKDRVYYPEDNGIDGMLNNSTTNEKALLKRCTDQERIDMIEAFENDVLAAEEDKRGFRNIVYPRILKQNGDSDEDAEYYAFTEMPNLDGVNIHKLSTALTISGFSIYSRIMAATNLAESLNRIRHYVGTHIRSIHPDKIYVNTDNGDVYIWIEQWLIQPTDSDKTDGFGFPPEWYSREDKTATETDIRFFITYVIFRLLCVDEPFDGSETLLQFPLLTEEAIRMIHANKYGFALSKGNNHVSEYIGQGLWKKWRALPNFLRSEIEKTFTVGIDAPDERTEIPVWVKAMQKLRDCLVFVNGQFRFCDPDVSYKVLFMIIDDYKIPVWPQKAIYWYHVDTPLEKLKNGIVAGVTSKDGSYYLTNLSDSNWSVTLGITSRWIYPDHEIEIVEGMTIQLENNKVIKVVNGLVDAPLKTFNVTVQDVPKDAPNNPDTDRYAAGDAVPDLSDSEGTVS
jgi:hypothetical protein